MGGRQRRLTPSLPKRHGIKPVQSTPGSIYHLTPSPIKAHACSFAIRRVSEKESIQNSFRAIIKFHRKMNDLFPRPAVTSGRSARAGQYGGCQRGISALSLPCDGRLQAFDFPVMRVVNIRSSHVRCGGLRRKRERQDRAQHRKKCFNLAQGRQSWR